MLKRTSYLQSFVVILLLFSSCSTVRVLKDDEVRLTGSSVTVPQDRRFDTAELADYIKQKGQGWSPAMCIYNWQNGKGGGWDRFVTKIGTAPEVFDSTLVQSTIDNLSLHLDYLGYYNSSITSQILSRGPKKVKVNYVVRLGKRYPIRSISYTIPTAGTFPKDFYADTLLRSLRPGSSYLSESLLESESERCAGAMRDKGYYGFSKNYFFFEADTLSVPDSASLHIILKNHTRNESDDVRTEFKIHTLGRITVNYPSDMKVRPEILRDLNRLRSGDVYSESRVSNTYSRFSGMQMFNSVSMEMTPRDSAVVDCAIDLQKGKQRGFKLGLEASVNSSGLLGIAPEITYYNKNVFHGGEYFSVSATFNRQFNLSGSQTGSLEASASASLIFPRLFPLSNRNIRGPNIPRTEINASYNYQNRPEYTRHIIRLTYGYRGTLRRCFYYQLNPISWNVVRMSDMDPDFENSLLDNPFLWNAFEDYFDLGAGGTITYDSRRSAASQASYWYARAGVDLSGNVLSLFKGVMRKDGDGAGLLMGVPFSQYVRADLTLGRTIYFGNENKSQLAFRLYGGAGFAYGNSSVIPFEKHFYGGGSNSLRGWVARTVGPGSQRLQDGWAIPNQTGNFKLEANAEWRFPIVWKIAGALFYDAGNIWNIGPSADEETAFSLKTIAMDWGVGLRVDINVLVLRLDAGFQVYDPSLLSEQGRSPWLGPKDWFGSSYAIHFGVGYPF